jgi:hypothetical protein
MALAWGQGWLRVGAMGDAGIGVLTYMYIHIGLAGPPTRLTHFFWRDPRETCYFGFGLFTSSQ